MIKHSNWSILSKILQPGEVILALPLVIVGLLHEGDLHPYEVLTRLKQRSMHSYVKINFGTLYYHFDRLREDGLIETIGVERGENRPDRTIYRVTAAGRAWFRSELLRQVTELEQVYFPIDAALPFLRYAEPDLVAEALRQRISSMEQLREEVAALRQVQPPFLDRGSHAVIRHALVLMNAEMGWMCELLAEVESGEFFGDAPPPFHVKGELGPEELERKEAAEAAVARFEAVADRLLRHSSSKRRARNGTAQQHKR